MSVLILLILSEEFNEAYTMDKEQNIILTDTARDRKGSHLCHCHCDYKTKHLYHFKQHIK